MIASTSIPTSSVSTSSVLTSIYDIISLANIIFISFVIGIIYCIYESPVWFSHEFACIFSLMCCIPLNAIINQTYMHLWIKKIELPLIKQGTLTNMIMCILIGIHLKSILLCNIAVISFIDLVACLLHCHFPNFVALSRGIKYINYLVIASCVMIFIGSLLRICENYYIFTSFLRICENYYIFTTSIHL